MSYVAECEKCGILERGSLEEAGDAADDHERFHDVRVKRVATDGGTLKDDTERLVIGWTCDDCDEAIGDEPRMWDLAERLRTEHEEETGHTTTVEVVEEQRIFPSQADRMEIAESMLDLAEDRSDRIEWICPECQRTGEHLDATKRCPGCDERLREILPDGGRSVDGTEQATLLGGKAERAECEYYDGCKNPVLFIDEILHYGEGEKPVKMCESCADEHTEIEGNEVQRLTPEDRYVSEPPEKMTVWIVAANYADDPHPHVEGIYDNEEAAREHEKELRDDAIGPVAWWVYNRSVDTGTDHSAGERRQEVDADVE